MKKLFSLFAILCIAFAWGINPASAATTVDMPVTSALDWNNADIKNASVQSNPTELGSTHTNTVATFSLSNPAEQQYFLFFTTGQKNSDVTITVSMTGENGYELTQDVTVVRTPGTWGPITQHRIDLGTVPAGACTLTFKGKDSGTDSYCGNWGGVKLLSLNDIISLPNVKQLSWTDATVTNATVESGMIVGSTRSNTVATFDIYNASEANYHLMFKTGHQKDNPTLTLELTDGDGFTYSRDIQVENTGSWTPTSLHYCYIENVPAGWYTLTIKTKALGDGNNSYAGNWSAPTIYTDDDFDNVLEGIALDDSQNGLASYSNGMKYTNGEIGWVRTNSSASWLALVPALANYEFVWNVARYADGVATITVTDFATGNVEKTVAFNLNDGMPRSMTKYYLPLGAITPGLKTITVDFSADNDSFLCNFKDVSFKHGRLYFIGEQTNNWDHSAAIPFTTTDGITYKAVLKHGISGAWKVTNGTWDWNFSHNAGMAFDGTDQDAVWFADNCTTTTDWRAEITFTFVPGSDMADVANNSKIRVNCYRRLYFVGEQTNGWNLNDAIEFDTDDNVHYTLTLPGGIHGEWKICDKTWDWTFGRDYVNDETHLQDAHPWLTTDARFNGKNFTAHTMFGQSVNIVFTYVEGSDNTNTDLRSQVVVKANGYTAIYFDNTIPEWEQPLVHYWGGSMLTIWPGTPMQRVPAEEIPARAASMASPISYTVADIWESVVPNDTQKVIFNDGLGNQTDSAGFDYVKGAVYDLNGRQGVYEGTTGVEEISAEAEENLPVEYYDLRGRRVANPAHGIYLRRQGTKVEKVLL